MEVVLSNTICIKLHSNFGENRKRFALQLRSKIIKVEHDALEVAECELSERSKSVS